MKVKSKFSYNIVLLDIRQHLICCIFSIEKQQRPKETKHSVPKEEKLNFIKPVAAIKREKTTQNLMQESNRKVANETLKGATSSMQEKRPRNPLLDDEEEEDDEMPRPFVVKQEPEKTTKTKTQTIMERFNINCKDCEKVNLYNLQFNHWFNQTMTAGFILHIKLKQTK